MFSYYGSKSKLIHNYPKPLFNVIKEPFAGSARYSLKYWTKEIFLYDANQLIINIWKYLQECTFKDLINLPRLKAGEKIIRTDFDCIEQANLMGFILQNGVSSPGLVCSKWGEVVIDKQIKDIAANVSKIKHWIIECKSYADVENDQCTWFIDPPYKRGGHKYKFSNKMIDFNHLSIYCKERLGQTIVCENYDADWLPFVPLTTGNGIKGLTKEGIWTNYHTHFNNIQQKIW